MALRYTRLMNRTLTNLFKSQSTIDAEQAERDAQIAAIREQHELEVNMILAQQEAERQALKADWDEQVAYANERLAKMKADTAEAVQDHTDRAKAHKAHMAKLAKAQFPVCIANDDPRLERLRVLGKLEKCGVDSKSENMLMLHGHPALLVRQIDPATDTVSQNVHVFFETPDKARDFARDHLPVFNV
jgi:hypothetical protein